MKRTSKEIEQKIIALYQEGKSMKAAGEPYNVTSATVKAILERNNIPKRTKGGIYALPEKDIINQYKSGDSCQIIANKYKVSFHTISNILEKYKIPRNNLYHNKALIEDYWETINSNDKAYFLGFMITDGNISGNMIRLQLSDKDIDILKVFATKTKNSNKIESDKRNLASFYVKRKKWADDLSKYGVIPNKTYKVYLPKLEDKYMPSLIRGCIDGDGWISYKSHQIGFCGNETIVTQIRDYLVSKLNVFNVKVLHPEEHLWQIAWQGKADIEKIGNYLYKDKEDCFLQRKYNNWIQIIHGNTEVITESKESVTP